MTKTRTLSDLARHLGLSPATVSRALAQHEQIALKTRERVAKAALELGYVPNRTAQALASGRTGFAGFLLPMRGRGLADPFLGEFVSALTEGFSAKGVELLLSAVPRDGSEQRHLESLITSGRVDGVVVSRIECADTRIALLQDHGVPFVAHGRLEHDESGYSWLDTDGESAFMEAFDLLYQAGHRRFGLLSLDDPLTFRQKREAGLRNAYAANGDPALTLRHVSCSRYDMDTRAQAIAGILSGADRPTAVLAIADGLALELMAEAQKQGLSVPDDLSIIGFDNIPAAAHVTPALTTFDACIADSATQLAEMLLVRINAPNAPHEQRLLRPQLILRGTHGTAPVIAG
ncbi:LacI family DNA-binding transcriptional regulator [Roseinatronobacter sp. S2]|uniref:LacI family DNA-binding transcriptional regulator n=1 Tax=Roseinatronobacter sp. S2 TaxID=3035471 RepID=UPI00240FB402|nr:LacI family DNA-binding transcriptional regulator [Roseinatronobacter sp. S2]WFE73501.1 LacI family DNA-binding transcriptional regulator [Roseinatronobacter sp. S2]